MWKRVIGDRENGRLCQKKPKFEGGDDRVSVFGSGRLNHILELSEVSRAFDVIRWVIEMESLVSGALIRLFMVLLSF
jgi:hypothetical protein